MLNEGTKANLNKTGWQTKHKKLGSRCVSTINVLKENVLSE